MKLTQDAVPSTPSKKPTLIAPITPQPTTPSTSSSLSPNISALLQARPKKTILIRDPNTLQEVKLPEKVEPKTPVKESAAKEEPKPEPVPSTEEEAKKEPMASQPAATETKVYKSEAPAAVATSSPKKPAQGRSPSPAKEPTKKEVTSQPEKSSSPVKRDVSPVPYSKTESSVEMQTKSPTKEKVVTSTNVSAPPQPSIPRVIAKTIDKSGTSKLCYTRDFLLKIRPYCTERPDDLPSVDAIIGEESQSSGNRRNSRRNDRDAMGSRSGRFPENPASSRMSAPSRQGGGRGPSGGSSKYPPGFGGRSDRNNRRGSGGSNFNRQSSRGSAPELPADFEPLVKSENRWIPKSALGKGTDADPVEQLTRKARSLLNKLTLERFDSISKKMLDLDLQNHEMVKELAVAIFEKAVDEPNFTNMYARLCHFLATKMPNYTDGKNEV
jgi:translation initiation factor 4G